MQTLGDTKNVLRVKNMIESYKSRLRKRTALENLQSQVKARELQLSAVLRILKRELTPDELTRINFCIRQEVETKPSLLSRLLGIQ